MAINPRDIPKPLKYTHGTAIDSTGHEVSIALPRCSECGIALIHYNLRQINYCPNCGQAIKREEYGE